MAGVHALWYISAVRRFGCLVIVVVARPLIGSAQLFIFRRFKGGGGSGDVSTLYIRSLLDGLVDKAQEGKIIVVEDLNMDEIKTKTIVNMLNALGADRKVLLVLPEKDEKVILSARNIPGVKTALVNTLNVYDILNCDKFIVVKDAVAQLEEVYK